MPYLERELLMINYYPEIEPYNSFKLKVSELHEIYVEEVGNPDGIPMLFLHGGPGGGLQSQYRRYFDPKKYRVILFDQRGCGQSTPFASLEENTTWDLVEDIEKIREKLSIESWGVFGGSWGSTLSLCYAIKHPSRVLGLFLRGIFLLREKEIQWFYQSGASKLFPDTWEKYLAPIPSKEREDLVNAYHERLNSDDEKIQLEAAKAWAVWEASTSKLEISQDLMDHHEEDKYAIAFARIENHYFVNEGFFDSDNWILENVSVVKDIPTWIVHGRYDVICPVENAWELKKVLPKADLRIIPLAGHSISEPAIANCLIEILDEFKV